MDSDYHETKNPVKNHIVPIGSLVKDVKVIDPETPVKDIKKYFDGGEPIKAAVVLSEDRPVGLIMNIYLDRILSQRFGFALYYDKSIKKIMDKSPLIIEHDTPMEMGAELAMGREKSKLFDHIIITRKGRLSGIVAVRDILYAMLQIQRESAHDMSSINELLHQEIEDRLKVERELVKFNKELEDRVMSRTSEIRESNEKLKKAAEAADAANQAKSDFFGQYEP